jgi:ABC-type nitrate/sulfonate/bicarbonate transport system substrate-binding protein
MRFTALALAIVGAAASAQAEPLRIRIGWANTPATISPLLFQKTDIMRHHGKSYVAEAVRFAGTTPALAALKAGELEIGSVSFSNVGAAIVQQGLHDLRIVADANQGGVEGYTSVEFFVRNDSGIRTVADLKGKVVASNAFGGAADFGLRAMLHRHGLVDKRDVTIVEAPYPTLGKKLLDREVALTALPPPFTYDPTFKANTRILFTVKDALGPTQQLVTGAMRGFLEKNRAPVTDFFEDYIIALRWFLDPKNRDEAIRVLARFTKLPEDQFSSWVFTKDGYYHDPWARPNVPALTQNLAALKEMGFLPVALDPTPYLDLSFIDEAARRLK